MPADTIPVRNRDGGSGTLNRTTVTVDLGARSYDIVIGRGLVAEAGRRLAEQFPRTRFAVVTDENVAALHLRPLTDALDEAGIEAVPIIVPAGERSKSIAELSRVVEAILAARLERTDMVIALGGGVVGDLAGFAAAVTRRGMDFVQIPTSLLAQVDSSVGGKTGINASAGKNLIGAFHQPRLVIADTAVLDTLPRREFAAGYAELAKYGLIGDADFFAWLEKHHEAIFAGGGERDEAVAHCCRAKADLVAADETEHGQRALLNLGHTFGHALEAWCGFDSERLIHGEAVSIGMVLAHQFSENLGHAAPEDTARVIRHLAAIGLPTEIAHISGGPPPVDQLMKHIAQDKKVRQGRLTFILTRGIGEAFIAEDVSAETVTIFLQQRISG
jgi:3-dehydroquinate synthase